MRSRTLLLALCVPILLGAAATWVAGSSLIAVRNQKVGPAPWPLAQLVSLAAAPAMRVEGWYLAGQGESLAPVVSFGLREADGVRVALTWLRRQAPGQRIGVIGISLGAASLVLCRDCPVDAVVLESMYPTIEEAVEDRLRMRLGPFGKPLGTLLLWQLPLRLDIQPAQLHPIARLPDLTSPLLVASGSADRHTTLAETRRLFAAAPEPKSLWIVDGAGHVDLHAHAPAEYERRIGGFLAKYLAGQALANP